jgi:recombination protein RecA
LTIAGEWWRIPLGEQKAKIATRFCSLTIDPTMAANFAALRSKVELALAGRVAAPFNYRDRQEVVTVSSGIPEIDLLTGGLPRGALTEIFGPSCSGRTSLLLSALSARTAQEEACALIDGGDAFDPHSAAAAGVELRKLLWVRCRNVEQTLRATDLLLQGGGFGLIAVDLSDIAPRLVRHVPLDSWFRFRRAVEDTPTILMLLEQESNAKSCASLGLRLEAGATGWSRMPVDGMERVDREGAAGGALNCSRLPWGWLLEGRSARGEVSRSRMQQGSAGYFLGGFSAAPRVANEGIFRTRMDWDFFSLPIAAKRK